MKTRTINILAFFILLLSISGCIVVKNDDKGDDKPLLLNLSPQPELAMSDILIRSNAGDMIAYLPRDWFLVNMEETAPADVIAVAVNPEYSISVVFSLIRKGDKIDELHAKEGLLGIARLCMERRAKKTAASVHQIGKYSTITMGPRNFSKYEYANADNTMNGISAVYKSSLNEYYEMSVFPMNLKGIVLPTREDIVKAFNSILTTVQY